MFLIISSSLSLSGHYMYVKTEGFPSPSTAVVQTPKFIVTGPTCRMKFWYNIDGLGKIGALDVSKLDACCKCLSLLL